MGLSFLCQDEDVSTEAGEGIDECAAAKTLVKPPDQLELTEAVSKTMPVVVMRCVQNSISQSLPLTCLVFLRKFCESKTSVLAEVQCLQHKLKWLAAGKQGEYALEQSSGLKTM